MRLRVSSPSPMANGSCDGEDFLKLWRNFLPVIDAVGGNAQGQRSDGGNRRIPSRAIRHHPGHGLDVGPPTVSFPASQTQAGGMDGVCRGSGECDSQVYLFDYLSALAFHTSEKTAQGLDRKSVV